MKEINTIIQFYHKLPESINCAIATVVHVDGSSYRRVGARMLVAANGQWMGGISGGCLEGDALRKAQQVIFSGKSKIITYDTREESSSSIGIGLGCNGLIDVLISPIHQSDEYNTIRILEYCIRKRQEHILITIIHDNDILNIGKTVQLDLFEKKNEIKTDVDWVLSQRRSKIIQLNHQKVLIEYLAPPIRLLIFGGQYDVLPLMQLKEILAWEATIICKSQNTDIRTLELADTIINQRENYSLPLMDDYTVALLMSHDYETDKNNLKRLLSKSPLSYIGILGPKKRARKIFDEIDISPENKSRIFAPVGLDTGAVSPEEIAISIVAEIRSFFSQRKGTSLKFREKTIHER